MLKILNWKTSLSYKIPTSILIAFAAFFFFLIPHQARAALCFSDADCPADSYCNDFGNGLYGCALKNPPTVEGGEKCGQYTNVCKPTYYCNQLFSPPKCTPQKIKNSDCEKPAECLSNNCENKKCTPEATSVNEDKYVPPIEPKLQIPIPDLKLTTIFTPVQEGEQRVLYIPTIAEYAAGVYRYLISIVGIIAGVMIVWAGTKWLMSAGNADMISDAKKKIGNAIIGLVLAVGSYIIFYLINPDLVTFKSLRIPLIEREEFEFIINSGNDEGGSVDGVSAACASEVETISIAEALQQQGKTGLVSLGSPQARLHKDAINALIKAAELAKTNNKTLHITPHGALRTLETQQKIFNKAVAKWGSEEKAKKYAAKPSCSAPHTTGRAIDACLGGSDICGKLNSSYATLKTPDVVLLQNIMMQAGWKRYCNEWWHFEYNLAGNNRCSP